MFNSPDDNLDYLPFEDWLNFIFDEKWSSMKDKDYVDLDDLNADIEIFVGNCIKLFEDPTLLLERYNEKQLEGGLFYFILSPKVSLNWFLWRKDKPVYLRRRFIASSVNFFKKIFTVKPLEHSCFMWWDCLRDFGDEKDPQVNEWMFEALSRILEIDSIDCQMSALHGLGHIEHVGKKTLIEKFLRRHPRFEDKEYALNAIEGNVL